MLYYKWTHLAASSWRRWDWTLEIPDAPTTIDAIIGRVHKNHRGHPVYFTFISFGECFEEIAHAIYKFYL